MDQVGRLYRSLDRESQQALKIAVKEKLQEGTTMVLYLAISQENDAALPVQNGPAEEGSSRNAVRDSSDESAHEQGQRRGNPPENPVQATAPTVEADTLRPGTDGGSYLGGAVAEDQKGWRIVFHTKAYRRYCDALDNRLDEIKRDEERGCYPPNPWCTGEDDRRLAWILFEGNVKTLEQMSDRDLDVAVNNLLRRAENDPFRVCGISRADLTKRVKDRPVTTQTEYDAPATVLCSTIAARGAESYCLPTKTADHRTPELTASSDMRRSAEFHRKLGVGSREPKAQGVLTLIHNDRLASHREQTSKNGAARLTNSWSTTSPGSQNRDTHYKTLPVPRTGGGDLEVFGPLTSWHPYSVH